MNHAYSRPLPDRDGWDAIFRGENQHPLIVWADDLTGAGNVAVPFARAGARTRVDFTNIASQNSADADVIATNLDCRQDVCPRLPAGVAPHFVKIDSLGRGHPGALINAILAVQPSPRSVLVAPAWPVMGRTVRGGYGPSEFGSVHWPTLLRTELDDAGPAVHRRVPSEPADPTSPVVIVADADVDEQLDGLIVDMISRYPDALLVGSQGLADACARMLPHRSATGATSPNRPLSGRIVAVLGSEHPATEHQWDAVRGHPDWTAVELTADGASRVDTSSSASHLALRVRARTEADLAGVLQIHADHVLAAVRSSERILLTGGRTASLVLSIAAITGAHNPRERLAGLTEYSRPQAPHTIYTKPGSVGEADLLVSLADHRAATTGRISR